MYTRERLVERGVDDFGSGNWGAPRDNSRGVHLGIDYLIAPGREVSSPVDGWVSRLGFPYSDDTSYRYVEVTDGRDLRHRLFYVKPTVEVGQRVRTLDPVGVAQDISARYSTADKHMLNHVHYEIKDADNNYIKPT